MTDVPIPQDNMDRGERQLSEYGLQTREKQKARRYYGVLESQFRNYFKMAVRRPGVTGTNLLQILECRLDNVVYRLGMAMSRPKLDSSYVMGTLP